MKKNLLYVTGQLIKEAKQKAKDFNLREGCKILLDSTSAFFVGKMDEQLVLIPYNSNEYVMGNGNGYIMYENGEKVKIFIVKK